MEANVFIDKLKAFGPKNGLSDLDQAFIEFKDILAKLATKNRGLFSLNVLCVLCRNLEKVPSWCNSINKWTLLALSVECVRETRTLNLPEQGTTLACVYHIHNYLVKESADIAPAMLLKLSYIPFEAETLITEYSKTYWNIIAIRITYIEKLKTKQFNILKLLPKLNEDILKVIKEYNSVQFCLSILTFLVKKLHFLYSDLDAKELNKVFEKIFEEIDMKNDQKYFTKLPYKDVFDIYLKWNECLYVIIENLSKIQFLNSVLNKVFQTCILHVGLRQDLKHCLQHLNEFCTILDNKDNVSIETILTNFITSCEAIENLGYTKAVNVIYPYITQYLRLYIENNVIYNKKKWQTKFPLQIQIECLKLMEFLLKKLKNCDQISKCENCTLKSGLHDALRLSFLAKNFIIVPLEESMSIGKLLPAYFLTILLQYKIIKDLCSMGCMNYEKFFRKLQTDVHNTAILLNKTQNYEYSIKLFDIYLCNEILHFKSETDIKNISRALYNKSICELEYKLFKNALLDAYLSLIFAYLDELSTEKYMSLVMDIKAKALKSSDEQTDTDAEELQMMTVLDACTEAIDKKMYGSLRAFFSNLQFSVLLKHEFDMYAKLWPSILPIAGVCKILYYLTIHDVPWTNVSDDKVQEILTTVILSTPLSVRSIHNEHYHTTITQILETFEAAPSSVEKKLFHVSLFFLKAEFDLAEAANKYKWKSSGPYQDPDQYETLRTLSQEHEVAKRAIRAVDMLTEIVKDIEKVPVTPNTRCVLQIAQVFVPRLLHLFRTRQGLQLAHLCCRLAGRLDDRISYLTNAGAILYHANKETKEVLQIIKIGSKYCAHLLKIDDSVEAALIFLCDCAKYYTKIGYTGLAVRLVQVVQSRVYHHERATHLELAMGRLLQAESDLSRGLAGVLGAHRHFITVANSETRWTSRRLRASYLNLHITYSGVTATLFCRRLVLWPRARSAAGAALPACSAAGQGALCHAGTNPAHIDDTRVEIDNRLKYILGVQPASDRTAVPTHETKSHQLFTPKQELETMLENLTFKKTRVSPMSSYINRIAGFECPEFLNHSDKCDCSACENPCSMILACQTANLEASMYFKAKEFEIAGNYFEGSLKCLKLVEKKLRPFRDENIEGYIAEIVEKIMIDKFSEVKIENFIEAAFFELSQTNYKAADQHTVTIHEILQENPSVDEYLKNEVLNVMTTSACLRKSISKKSTDDNLEVEFENLKLSPAKPVEIAPKTPETKAEKPPKMSQLKVPNEEMPHMKRRVIKLNLDENISDEKEACTKKVKSKRTEFEIPVPVTAKPVLETITPTPRKTKSVKTKALVPSICEPSTSIFEFATPKLKNADKAVFTPMETSTDQFFTPMSTVKTYSKKSLRLGIVKNLENELSTPKSDFKIKLDESKTVPKIGSLDDAVDTAKDKEKKKANREIPRSETKKIETGSTKALKEKKSLLRSTSPGKLEKDDNKPVRASRLRQSVKFSDKQ